MARSDGNGDGNGSGPHERERRALLQQVAAEVTETAHWLGKDRLAPEVMAAMGRVPRHAFVPRTEEAYAYRNEALPIGLGQTISQPYIVAVMTDQAVGGLAVGGQAVGGQAVGSTGEVAGGAAGVGADVRVLEVGTGSGYQAAVLAELGCAVWSIEALPELAEAAAARLKDLGYDKVHCRQGDGAAGWPEAAPFDAIVVTAAATAIPPALVDQMKRGGRMIVPLGAPDGPRRHSASQRLLRLEKALDGSLKETVILPVAFVPLVAPPTDDT